MPARVSASDVPVPSAPKPIMSTCFVASFCWPDSPIGANKDCREYRSPIKYSNLSTGYLPSLFVFLEFFPLQTLTVQPRLLVSSLLPFSQDPSPLKPPYLITPHQLLIPSDRHSVAPVTTQIC